MFLSSCEYLFAPWHIVIRLRLSVFNNFCFIFVYLYYIFFDLITTAINKYWNIYACRLSGKTFICFYLQGFLLRLVKQGQNMCRSAVNKVFSILRFYQHLQKTRICSDKVPITHSQIVLSLFSFYLGLGQVFRTLQRLVSECAITLKNCLRCY